MGVIEQAVANLENLEEDFAPVLIQLGSKHPIRADFSGDKVDIFIQSVLSIWNSVLAEKMTPECSTAWKTLLKYILGKIRQGYHYKIKEDKIKNKK